MNIVFFGSAAFAAEVLCRLTEKHQVTLVVTRPTTDDAPMPVVSAAQQRRIPVVCDYESVHLAHPDFLVACDYGALLPASVLALAPALNVHPSLLPRWRGAAPIEYAILAGDNETGVTVMLMDAQRDTGQLLASQRLRMTPEMTGGYLRQILAPLAADMLLAVLGNYHAYTPQPQHDEQATYAPKLRTSDRLLDFSRPAMHLRRQVMAFLPHPCAYGFLDGQRVKVYAAEVVATPTDACAGTLLAARDSIVIACGAEALAISALQRAGRKRLSAADYLRGASLHKRIGQVVTG